MVSVFALKQRRVCLTLRSRFRAQPVALGRRNFDSASCAHRCVNFSSRFSYLSSCAAEQLGVQYAIRRGGVRTLAPSGNLYILNCPYKME